VDLWDGWSLSLPTPCRVVRNEDGSWSAFDASRVVDVSILTVGGVRSGEPVSAEDMLKAPDGAPVRAANGCLSFAETIVEDDQPGVVFLNVRAAASMTSCFVSIGYRDVADATWAKEVWGSLTHGVPVP
jgi:hypothetical protein